MASSRKIKLLKLSVFRFGLSPDRIYSTAYVIWAFVQAFLFYFPLSVSWHTVIPFPQSGKGDSAADFFGFAASSLGRCLLNLHKGSKANRPFFYFLGTSSLLCSTREKTSIPQGGRRFFVIQISAFSAVKSPFFIIFRSADGYSGRHHAPAGFRWLYHPLRHCS